MAPPPKLALLVITADGGIYNQLEQCWRNWSMQNENVVDTFFVRGNPDISKTFLRDDQTIITPHSECLIPGVLDKTIDAMEFVINHYDIDFLIRTNLSSFWSSGNNLRNNCLSHLPTKRCYAGYAGIYKGQLFISGAGIILSSDIVRQLISNQENFDRELPDDVAIGRLILGNMAPIRVLQNSRIDITHFKNQPDDDVISSLIPTIFNNKNITHVRLKNPNRQVDVTLFQRMLDNQKINNPE
jgi:hypothetical protein